MMIAIFVAIITYVLYRKGKLKESTALSIPLLAFYLSFAVTVTIIERVTSAHPKYNLQVFWTYMSIAEGTTELISEIFWNIVLFIPIGFLFSYIIPKKRWWLNAVSGMLISSGIEIMQLVLHRGYFEFDDIIHNTFGTVIGIGIWVLVNLFLLSKITIFKQK